MICLDALTCYQNKVLNEIRVVLDTAHTTCNAIVKQIQESSIEYLHAVEPLRVPHRETMAARVEEAVARWSHVQGMLEPLVSNFQLESLQLLGTIKVRAVESIGEYRELETRQLKSEYMSERKLLLSSFRKHFTDYDLSESSIFERFNAEVGCN